MKRRFRTPVSSQKKVKMEYFNFSDPRVASYPLMDNPVWNTVSVLLYLYIVYYGGPAFMKDRKPFEFRKFLFVYNMALVVLSGWMFYEVSYGGKYRNSRRHSSLARLVGGTAILSSAKNSAKRSR